MPKDTVELYEKEFETFEDQLRDWYKARRASTMQKLLRSEYLGTDVVQRVISELGAEEMQDVLKGKATLEELRTLEKEREEAAKTSPWWQKFLVKWIPAVAGTVVGGLVGGPSGALTGAGVGYEAGEKGLAPTLGMKLSPDIETQKTMEAEINKRLTFLQNFLDELRAEPEVEIPEELKLDRFEGRNKQNWWEYWQP